MQTILKTGAFIVLGFCSAPALPQMGPGVRFRHEGGYGRPHAARTYGLGGYCGGWAGGIGRGYGARRAFGYG